MKTIDAIIAETGVKIDMTKKEMFLFTLAIKDAGISSYQRIIAALVREAKVDEAYHAKVVRIEKGWCFCQSLTDKTDALVQYLRSGLDAYSIRLKIWF